jgi:hypothetical protein
MFRGDTGQLSITMWAAAEAAERLGHPEPRSEHLLMALAAGTTEAGAFLRRQGVGAAMIERVITQPGVAPASIEVDRELLESVGVDLNGLLASAGAAALAPRSGKRPLFPLGRKRQWVGSADFRAAYEASLRLALARMEREHRPEHLLIALLAFDRGCAWLLSQVGVDRLRLQWAAKLEFPPPHRNAFIRAARHGTWNRRYRAIVRRYENTSGSPALKTV